MALLKWLRCRPAIGLHHELGELPSREGSRCREQVLHMCGLPIHDAAAPAAFDADRPHQLLAWRGMDDVDFVAVGVAPKIQAVVRNGRITTVLGILSLQVANARAS